MPPKISQPLKTLLLALMLSIGVSYTYAAWTSPTAAPTGGNIEAPVNVGGGTQVKAGALTVNGLLTAVSNLVVDGNVGIGVPSPAEKLEVNGNVKATAFLYSSDRNLKENITNLSPDVLAKLLQLQGVSYAWKDSGKEGIGLIAQDVEEVFPELVSTDSTTGLKSLQYAGLIAPLIEAVKQQQVQIEELKAQVKELQGR